LAGLRVEEEGRLVVVVHGTVISTVGSIERDLDSCLAEVVRLWGLAGGSGRVLDHGLAISTQSNKVTESGVLNVERTIGCSEWLEVLSTNADLVASSLWTSVWINHGDLWVVVVPVLDRVFRLLLTIEGDREWHTSLNNIRRRCNTSDVAIIVDLGWNGPGTEGAAGILAELDEVLAPDLNGGTSILWSVRWLDGLH
jgi:hypothetical protein